MPKQEQAIDLRVLLDSIQEFIVAKDGDGRWLFTNRTVLEAYDMIGFDYSGVTDAELMELKPAFADAFAYNIATDEIAWSAAAPTLIEKSFKGPDGHVNTWEVIKTPYFDSNGNREKLIIVSRNVTARKLAENALQESERRLRLLAYLDPLTGVPNRRSILDQISEYLRGIQDGQTCALLYVDLDKFKLINDENGHEFGDKLLLAFVERVKANLREDDLLGRIGGDEFIIFLRETTNLSALNIAERLCEALQRPWALEDVHLLTSSSIGVAFPAGADTSVHELLRHADEALYRAKRAGRSRVMVYEPSEI